MTYRGDIHETREAFYISWEDVPSTSNKGTKDTDHTIHIVAFMKILTKKEGVIKESSKWTKVKMEKCYKSENIIAK